MKKLDFIIAIVVLVIAGGALAANQHRTQMIESMSKTLRAEITVNGALYKVVPLFEKNQEIVIETGSNINVIVFNDKGVFVRESNCFDHICEQTGIISRPGEIIACLPHKVIIEIKGDMGVEVDNISN